MRATMAASMAATPNAGKANLYQQQMDQLKQVRSTLLTNAAASGEWDTVTTKQLSSTQALTKAINEQKLTFKQARQAGMETFRQAIREQEALRNSMLTQTTGNTFGRGSADLFIPKNLTRDLTSARTQLGFMSQALSSISQQTINWGKNTQWAGRQIMVGLTVPLGIAAMGAGKLAYDVDKNLTRIAKVYDTSATTQMGQEEELAAVRADSLENATNMAKTYGTAMSEVLEITAQLAATGLTGQQLTDTTSEVTRISFLGDLDYQQSIDMTIALQTAFKLSNEELTESFNFMNAVENATSLSIQDIAEATPRAASALSSLGVTVQEMTILLTSMKESGVNAAEGANALKSATTRLLNPTRAASQMFAGFGINIENVVQKNGGNLFKILSDLSTQMQDLDDLTKQQAIAELFGTYQFNRLNASLTNLGDALTGTGDDANQTAKAIELAGQSAGSWADTATSEVQRMQQSISGRFKIAVESLKAELVPLGQIVLQVLTPVLEFVSKLVSGFNDLSSFSKTAILTMLGVGAVIGPVVMLAGIMGNLIGQAGKGIGAIGSLIARFKIMTPEQRAQDLLARRAASSLDTQASSAAILTQSINTLTAAMERNAVAQGLMVSANGQIGNRTITKNKNGKDVYAAGSVNDAGQKIGGRMITAADAALLATATANSATIADNATTTKRSFGGAAKAALGIGAGVGAMAIMASGSSSMLANMTGVGLMILSMGAGGPILGKLLTGVKALLNPAKAFRAVMLAANTLIVRAALGIGTWIAAAGGFGAVLTTKIIPFLLRVAGPVGLLAAAAGFLITMYNKTTQIADRQKEINASTSQWADILGFTEQRGTLDDGSQDLSSYEGRVDLVRQLTEANSGLAESLAEAKKEGGDFGRVFDLAMREALKVITGGGTFDQARVAFQTAVQAAGLNEAQMETLTLRFDAVDISDPENLNNQFVTQIKQVFDDLPDDISGDFWTRLMHPSDNISDEAKAAATEAANLMMNSFLNADSDIARGGIFNNFREQLDDQFAPAFAALRVKNAALFNSMGIDSAEELAEGIQSAWQKEQDGIDLSANEQNLLDSYLDDQDMMDFQQNYRDMMEDILQTVGTALGKSQSEIDEWINQLLTLNNVQSDMGLSLKTVSEASDEYANYMSRAGMAGAEMSEAQQLIVLNGYRAQAGLEAATSVTQGFEQAAVDAAEGAAVLGSSLGSLSEAQITGFLQDAYSGTMNDVYAEAERLASEQNRAEIDGIQAAGEARSDALDARANRESKFYENRQEEMDKAFKAEEKAQKDSWDRREKQEDDYWEGRLEAIDAAIDANDAQSEARIDAINKQMEAEERADELRQRIFEAEKLRIQRLAELQNANIDFNAALNSGDNDEAARVFNNTQATVSQWGVDDTATSTEDAKAKRKDAYQAEIDLIESETKARSEALESQKKKLEEARDFAIESLKVQRQAEEDALQTRKDIATETLRAQKEASAEATRALQEDAKRQTQNAVDSAQRRQEADKRALDASMRALKEFVPTNKEELAKHISDVEAMYGKYGINLTAQGNGWAGTIGNALSKNIAIASARLQNEINWTGIGQQIASQIAGGTGVSMTDLQYFLQNGRFPQQGELTGVAGAIKQFFTGSRHNGGQVGSRHAGGEIGFSSKDRTGVQRSAGLMPSESLIVAKNDEFVVNGKATRKNLPLLEQINAGGTPVVHSRHTGGIVEAASVIPAAYGAMLGQTLKMGISQWIVENGLKDYQKQLDANEAANAGNYSGLGGGGNGGYPGSGMTWTYLEAIRKQLFPSSVLTSAVRRGDSGNHGSGMAIDIGVPGNRPALLQPIAQKIAQLYPNSSELINKSGGSIKNGRTVPASFWGAATWNDHADHVHWAMKPDAMNSIPAASPGGGGAFSKATGGGTPVVGGAPGTVEGNRAIVQQQAAARGWTGAQWTALNSLIMGESGYRNTAQNPTSTAYGMFQFLNSTWGGYGVAKTSDPAQQTVAGLRYIADRYGNPSNAYAKWSSRSPHWYDNGGYLQPGLTTVMNGTKKPEPVFTAEQFGTMKSLVSGSLSAYSTFGGNTQGGGGVVETVSNDIRLTIDLRGATVRDDDIDRIKQAVKDVTNDQNSKLGRGRKLTDA